MSNKKKVGISMNKEIIDKIKELSEIKGTTKIAIMETAIEKYYSENKEITTGDKTIELMFTEIETYYKKVRKKYAKVVQHGEI